MRPFILIGKLGKRQLQTQFIKHVCNPKCSHLDKGWILHDFEEKFFEIKRDLNRILDGKLTQQWYMALQN